MRDRPVGVLGCYDVTEGAWAADLSRTGSFADVLGDSASYQIPPRIELTYAEGRRWGREVRVPPGALPTPQSTKAWRMAGDSLALLFNNGFYGVRAALSRAPDGWQGEASTVSDARQDRPFRRRVALTRVGCASPPPVWDSLVPPMQRHVDLADGTRVTLGEPLPEHLVWTPRGSGAVLIEGRTAGVFPPTDSVVVLIDRLTERVALVQLKWAPRAGPERLVFALTDLMGPPDVSDEGRTLRWRSHTTRFTLFLADEGMRRVLFQDPRYR